MNGFAHRQRVLEQRRQLGDGQRRGDGRAQQRDGLPLGVFAQLDGRLPAPRDQNAWNVVAERRRKRLRTRRGSKAVEEAHLAFAEDEDTARLQVVVESRQSEPGLLNVRAGDAAIEPRAAAQQFDVVKMIRDMVTGLAQRLEANPDDLDGWKRLGRSYLVLEDAARAKQAYSRAVALAPTDMALLGDYAQATLLASGPAALPPQSVDALRTRLDSDGSDPTALWLVGLAEADAGNNRTAAGLWERLLPQLPPGTPAHDNLRARIAALPPAD